MPTPAFTSIRRTANCFSLGESRVPNPGQFNLVHNIACDDEGWVYIADRENHRVQVFDSNGKFETQWHNLMRPCGLFVTRGKEPIAVIGELGPETVASLTKGVPNLGPRLSVVSGTGQILAHLGTEPIGEGLGQFIAPHGIALDSAGTSMSPKSPTPIGQSSLAQNQITSWFAAKTSSREPTDGIRNDGGLEERNGRWGERRAWWRQQSGQCATLDGAEGATPAPPPNDERILDRTFGERPHASRLVNVPRLDYPA